MANEMECKNSRRQCRTEQLTDCSHSKEKIYRYHQGKQHESGWSVVVQKVVGEMINCRWKVLLGNADTMM